MTLSLEVLWNGLLSLVLIPLFWILMYLNNRITSTSEASSASIERIWKSMAEHREDVPKTYVTKIDLQNTQAQLISRFDRLEEKIDRIAGARQ